VHRLISVYRLSILFLVCGLRLGVAADANPNVLFIVCDDLNWHVGPGGYEYTKTPHLDGLAREGVTFDRAYCQYPVCGPSRGSFLSGLYPESTGILDNNSDIRDKLPQVTSMPQWFRERGYWTARTGKVFHTAKTNPAEAWDASPERFANDELGIVTKARKEFEKEHGTTHGKNRKLWKKALESLSKQTRGQTSPGYGPTDLADDQHKDGKNALQVIDWLTKKPYGEKPFFIVCGIQKPHVPFLAPQKYFDRYPLKGVKYVKNPDNDWADIPIMAASHRYKAFGFELDQENDALRREYMQAYHACVTFLDAQIGRVLKEVKRQGYWNDTIVVFTSDHGYHLGEHSMWGKVTLFEECARVPMVFRVPGLTPAGKRSQALVELVDLFPTLTDLAGVDAPKYLQGKSIRPQLKNPNLAGKEEAYTVVARGSRMGRSLRTQRYRYAEWNSPELAELYDLDADPREFTNLVNEPKHAELRQRLSARLKVLSARRPNGLR